VTGWIVAGLIGVPLALIALHFIKKSTSLKVENEILQKQVKAVKAQMDIASRPHADPASILDAMQNGDL
jgi:hypothetical protein